MIKINKYLLLLVLVCLVHSLHAQEKPRSSSWISPMSSIREKAKAAAKADSLRAQQKAGYTWNPKTRTYDKKVLPTITAHQQTFDVRTADGRMTLPSNDSVWVMPAKANEKGYWVTTPASKFHNNNIKTHHSYSISENKINLPSFNGQKVDYNLSSHDLRWLEKSEVKEVVLDGEQQKTTIHYFKKVNLTKITFKGANHIVVADTLLIPAAIDSDPKLFAWKTGQIQIVANHLIYNSPILLGAQAVVKPNFIFSAKSIVFRSPYQNLTQIQLSVAPPLVKIPTYTRSPHDRRPAPSISSYRSSFTLNEDLLLNRLFISVMQNTLNTLNTTSSNWEKDGLLNEFQSYRMNRVNITLLGHDNEYQALFNNLCDRFDERYRNYQVEKYRELNDLKILVDGNIDKLPAQPFDYYVLPTQASLLPVANENTAAIDALGTITHNPKGESELILHLEAKLDYKEDNFNKASKVLHEAGLVLTEGFPYKLAFVEPQPLKINGRTRGKIIPIGQQIVRLEINLSEGTKTLAELFLKPLYFSLDYTFNETKNTSAQILSLNIDSELLKGFSFEEPQKSFTIIENTSFTDAVRVSSKLSANLPDEGTLNYVEVLLEFDFQNKKTFHGPYRLSSYGTLSSELTVPFFKHAEGYTVCVNGLAYYENGIRKIKTFKTTAQIILLDEGVFE